jgi:hypothetical protein
MAIFPIIATMEPDKLRLKLGLGLHTWFLSTRLFNRFLLTRLLTRVLLTCLLTFFPKEHFPQSAHKLDRLLKIIFFVEETWVELWLWTLLAQLVCDLRVGSGIFFGYASHSRAYHVLNLETNQIVETCEVTFDKTHPCSQLVFECACDDELGEEIFKEWEHEHGDDEDDSVVPAAEHVHTTSTTVVDGPSPTPTTTTQVQGEVVVEGDVASRQEPPRRVQVDHPASRIISDMNERTT